MNEWTAKICIVVALSEKHRAIGMAGKLLWHIPADMKRFKALTLGHPIIMGRKTFESIIGYLGKPLPGRANLVVTRDPDYTYEGIETFTSIEAAIARALELDDEEIHIGGGSEIYKQVLPYTDKLYLTIVDDEPVADSYFPEFENDFDVAVKHPIQEHNGLSYQWIDYQRKRS
ncbi:MAG: dihydrofolate reductase [Patescibacteria group bacterium]